MAPERRTEVLRVARVQADDAAICRAAALLREGKLVAFPTETVYGLGARVGDEAAVRSIFAAKGRPASVPLIVHVRGVDQLGEYVSPVPAVARELAGRCWPGPLTLVATRSDRVPDVVTAGGASVGVRAPAHPVALALIEALGEGIAAPSANLYHRLPPVRAEHVLGSLDGRIDAVLDAGRCPGGLESTVVDLRSEPALVVRRGAVPASSLGIALRGPPLPEPVAAADGWVVIGEAGEYGSWALGRGRVGRLKLGGAGAGALERPMPCSPVAYAAAMYDDLHVLWSEGCDLVWVDAPPREGGWLPIWDRLARLSASLSRR